MKDLDVRTVPLEGVNLIEASAGTGKTYAIAFLYVRLVLEKTFEVPEILVVTFTEAATEELKIRIRKNLRDCLDAVMTGEARDPNISWLAEGIQDRLSARRLLENALRNFDEAAIFTIHGLCHRTLADFAFETGTLFDSELTTDPSEMIRSIVDDFYRIRIAGQTGGTGADLAGYAVKKGLTPEGFLSLLSCSRPDARIIPENASPGSVSLEDLIEKYDGICSVFRKDFLSWRGEAETILLNLCENKALSGKFYRKNWIDGWFEKIGLWVENTSSGGISFPDEKALAKFADAPEAIKKGNTFPEHEFFSRCACLKDVCEELSRALDGYMIDLRREFFSWVEKEFPARKEASSVLSFDDLLTGLNDALRGPRSKEVIAAMNSRYRSALIDEFQDTDPVQFEIFDTVFDGSNGPVFYIGDPKQAIYAFRGADIFTYMRAALKVDAERKYTLGRNWRSAKGLVDAVNTIFECTDNPFVYEKIRISSAQAAAEYDPEENIEGIRFFPAQAAAEEGEHSLTGSPGSELNLWLVSPEKRITVSSAERLIFDATASEISRLVRGGHAGEVLVDGEPLRPRHVAVLVRSNMQARKMKDRLSSLRIPCVLFSDEDVFDTHEAFEMEILLKGILEYRDQSCVLAAMCTSMMGFDAAELDAPRVDTVAGSFTVYHEEWAKYGFMYMFRSVLKKQRVMSRVLGYAGGERRLTNILHLAEHIHTESAMSGMNELLKWFSMKRDPENPGRTHEELRLESDDEALRIVTIHKSKGLEYPVVFCPFSWKGLRKKNSSDIALFHDADKDWSYTVDLGSEDHDAHLDAGMKEDLAESVRLLYVALTRASCRCYLVWGNMNASETSAEAYLFHNKYMEDGDTILRSMEPLKKLQPDTIMSDLRRIEDASDGTITLASLPEDPPVAFECARKDPVELACRRFGAKVRSAWRMMSFSSLVTDAPQIPEIPEPGTREVRDGEEPAGQLDIFSFPRGARPGTMLHSVFENADYTGDAESRETIISNALEEYGFGQEWLPAVCSMTENVLGTSLDGKISLDMIAPERRMNELEFFFPVSAPFRFGSIEGIEGGFMRGFIDLVFEHDGRYYIVDWKSNHLGSSAGDYNEKTLEEEMKKNRYDLQYLIYTVALDLFLEARIPGYSYEENFGGVFYIFLRGVEPGETTGIFSARPDRETIEELKKNVPANSDPD